MGKSWENLGVPLAGVPERGRREKAPDFTRFQFGDTNLKNQTGVKLDFGFYNFLPPSVTIRFGLPISDSI